MLPIYRSSTVLSLAKIECLPRVELSKNWNGENSNRRLLCAAAIDSKNLYLVASAPDAALELCPSKPGEFKEGLWESDVAELFISSDGKSYQEFNLSPSASWWSSTFSAPRVRGSDTFNNITVEALSTKSANSWSSAISIPRSALKISLDKEESIRANFCACLGNTTRSYLSYISLPGTKADFHQPMALAQVAFLAVS